MAPDQSRAPGIGGCLAAEAYDAADRRLADTDAFLDRAYPGDDGTRQPVHTVYVPGHRFGADTVADWARQAGSALDHFGGAESVCAELGLGEDAGPLADRVTAKLAAEPIEDLRVDFEDGYQNTGDEDADAARAATALAGLAAGGQAPPFFGIRFKCFEAPTRRRGIRTLDVFLSTLLEHGELPPGLRLTLPKVSTLSQVEAMVELCSSYEETAGLPAGSLGFEIQVETPQLIMAIDGSSPLVAAIAAAQGRVTGLHYGTYDYSASLQIAAGYQSMEHPVADHAKLIMQLAAAGTGVQLSDGSTNIVPVGPPDHVLSAWRLHLRLVRRSLESGFYQGWDMHPAQLPTRYLATFAFYRDGFVAAASRLGAYLAAQSDAAQAGHSGSPAVLDEPATARALARYLLRGLLCGAIAEDEVTAAAGVDTATLGRLARPSTPDPAPAAGSAVANA